jgi:hypothetical protein
VWRFHRRAASNAPVHFGLADESTRSAAAIESNNASLTGLPMELATQVNPEWYLERYPDVRASSLDPTEHFVTCGHSEGRSPNELFDVSWYLSTYTDVAQAGSDALLHFLCFGWKEGRHPGPQTNAEQYFIKYPHNASIRELTGSWEQRKVVPNSLPISSKISERSYVNAARPFGRFTSFDLDHLPSITLPVGVEIALDRTKCAHFAYGWHPVESQGCWTKAPRAGFSFALDEPEKRDHYRLHFALAFLKTMTTPQQLQCWLGPCCLLNALVEHHGISELQMPLPSRLADPVGVYNVRFNFPFLRLPNDGDGINDARRLGFILHSVTIER